MRFSLILATCGRTVELPRFLSSLAGQAFRDFELIVVDQNPDERLVPVLDPFRNCFPILHFRSRKGLSRARNAGLLRSRGEIVGFPDDDCWYPLTLLEEVHFFFDKHPDADGLIGRAVDESGASVSGRWGNNAGYVNKQNAWYQGTSISMFFTRSLMDRLKGFDETLGLGADTPWKSSEDRDILIRAAENDDCLYYDPSVIVRHPRDEKGAATKERAYSYSLGVGHILKIHRYPWWFVLYMLLRPIGGMLISTILVNKGRFLYHWSVFAGRLSGVRA